MAAPADFDPVEKPLSLALGTKDSLLDQATVGKIQDLLAKKTEVPHEIRVSWRPSFGAAVFNSDGLGADILGNLAV